MTSNLLKDPALQPLIYRINPVHTQRENRPIPLSPPTTTAILSLFSYMVVKVIESQTGIHRFPLSLPASLQ